MHTPYSYDWNTPYAIRWRGWLSLIFRFRLSQVEMNHRIKKTQHTFQMRAKKKQKITDAKSNLRFAFFRIPKFGLLIICAYNVWLMRVYCWNINWMAYEKKNWTIKLTFDAISYSRSWRWFFSLRMSMQCDGECGPLSIFHCITYFSFWLPWIPQFNFSLTFIEIVADPFFPANFPT